MRKEFWPPGFRNEFWPRLSTTAPENARETWSETAPAGKISKMSNATSLRKALITIGALCLGVAVLPQWSTVKTSPPNVERGVFSIGFPSAPWFKFVKERRENPDKSWTYSSSY